MRSLRNDGHGSGPRRNDPARIVTPEINIYRSPLHRVVASSSSRGGFLCERARVNPLSLSLFHSVSLVGGEREERHWETAAYYTPRHLNSSRSRWYIASCRARITVPDGLFSKPARAMTEDWVTCRDTHTRGNFNATLYIFTLFLLPIEIWQFDFFK